MTESNFLDCTLRDGGYYNQWHFSKNFTDKYLKALEKIGFKNVEIGFRFFESVRTKGLNAYCDPNFIKSLKISENINLGIMFNGSDLIKYKNKLNYFYESLNTKKINFVRIACHLEEIKNVDFFVKILKKKKIKVMINVMQISEIKKNRIKYIANHVKKIKPDVLYLADSLGSMNKKNLISLYKNFKKYWKGPMGLHAHDNIKQALKNSLALENEGIEWIDSTITGMGRGPGNTKSEDIVRSFKKNFEYSYFKNFKNYINKYFIPLKKKYKWGTNSYYRTAAKFRIHPSYVQTLLTDKRFKEYDKKFLINNLKRKETSKFELNKIFLAINKDKKKYKNNFKILNKLEKILIIGSSIKNSYDINKIEKYIKRNNIFTIALNNTEHVKSHYINLRVICYPLRVIGELKNIKRDTNYVLPYSFIPKPIHKKIPKNVFNFNLKIGKKNNFFKISNYCELEIPIAIGYALFIANKMNAKNFFFYGFDNIIGKDKIKMDETKQMLFDFKKQNKNVKFNFLNL